MAVHVVGVRRAFGLLLNCMAEVIHIEDGQYANYDFHSWREISELKAEFKEPDEDWIRSVNFEVCVPRVLRLLYYNRLPKQRVRLNRRNIFARDANLCQYCGKRFSTSELSLDHVLPTCRGGDTSWENLVCACVKCNVRKGGRTPRHAASWRGTVRADCGQFRIVPRVLPQRESRKTRMLATQRGQHEGLAPNRLRLPLAKLRSET